MFQEPLTVRQFGRSLRMHVTLFRNLDVREFRDDAKIKFIKFRYGISNIKQWGNW